MKKKKFFVDFIIYVLLITVLLITLFPLIFTIAGSFKTNMELMIHPEKILPMEPTLNNYKEIFTSKSMNIPRMFMNSVYYTLTCMVITLSISSVTGYVFARDDFPGSKIVLTAFTSTIFISVSGITIYPIFRILNLFNLASSLNGLILKHVFSVGVVNIHLVKGFVKQLPKELDEAAQIDGCGFMSTFTKVILPNLKPIIATLSILSFKRYWNEYYMPTLFTISRPEQQTLMVGLQRLKTSGDAAGNWNLMLAGATISMLPILVVYAICNKYFVDGITAGAVKG